MIEFENVFYNYPDGTEALKGIDYRIEKGEKIALVGPNGSGKSTLLLHTNGILLPTSGAVKVNGQLITQKNLKEVRRAVGLIFQDCDDQVFSPTVCDDVAFGPMNLGLKKEQVARRVEDALELVGLTGYEKRSSHHISGGEKKKVALAGILAMEPDVIVLDEPTANLDPESAESLVDVLNDLHNSGKTILIATHEVDLVCEWAERVCVLYDGMIMRDCTPDEAFSDPDLMHRTKLRPPVAYRIFEGIANPIPTTIAKAREKLRALTPK